MNATDSLHALAIGQRPGGDGLLGNARCDWGGNEWVGEEEVLALFAGSPFVPGEEARIVETGQGIAWIGREGAIVADLYAGRIGRLWRIGAGAPAEREPAVDVAFDPDMHQQRGDLAFRPQDCPELASEAVSQVRAAGLALLERQRQGGAVRVRGFVVRGFGDLQGAAALLAVYGLTGGKTRQSQFAYAAVAIGSGDPVTAFEVPPERSWTPRL